MIEKLREVRGRLRQMTDEQRRIALWFLCMAFVERNQSEVVDALLTMAETYD